MHACATIKHVSKQATTSCSAYKKHINPPKTAVKVAASQPRAWYAFMTKDTVALLRTRAAPAAPRRKAAAVAKNHITYTMKAKSMATTSCFLLLKCWFDEQSPWV